MSQLYALCRTVHDRLESRHGHDPLELIRAKGALVARTGFVVSLVMPTDPDDPEKIVALRRAARAFDIEL